MRAADAFEDFERWHQDRRNRLCHDLGIPTITLGVLGALAGVPLVGPVDLGLALLAGTLAFDLWFAPRQALGVSALGLALWAVGRLMPAEALALAFALGWVLQLAGHRVFERNAPAFTDNALHLVVGPRWIVWRWQRALLERR